MARPKREGVLGFEHKASEEKFIVLLDKTFGNDGYAFWYKLMEMLCENAGHYIDCNKDVNWDYLCEKTHLDEGRALDIIEYLCDLGQLDSELWKVNVIFAQSLMDDISKIYTKRKRASPERPEPQNFRSRNPRIQISPELSLQKSPKTYDVKSTSINNDNPANERAQAMILKILEDQSDS